jgi:hypothetical protein
LGAGGEFGRQGVRSRPAFPRRDERDQARALDDSVYAGARTGFQHRYEAIRVPDAPQAREAAGDLLNRFALWMSEGPRGTCSAR